MTSDDDDEYDNDDDNDNDNDNDDEYDDDLVVSFQEFQEGGIQQTACQPSWSHLGLSETMEAK